MSIIRFSTSIQRSDWQAMAASEHLPCTSPWLTGENCTYFGHICFFLITGYKPCVIYIQCRTIVNTVTTFHMWTFWLCFLFEMVIKEQRNKSHSGFGNNPPKIGLFWCFQFHLETAGSWCDDKRGSLSNNYILIWPGNAPGGPLYRMARETRLSCLGGN